MLFALILFSQSVGSLPPWAMLQVLLVWSERWWVDRDVVYLMHPRLSSFDSPEDLWCSASAESSNSFSCECLTPNQPEYHTTRSTYSSRRDRSSESWTLFSLSPVCIAWNLPNWAHMKGALAIGCTGEGKQQVVLSGRFEPEKVLGCLEFPWA